MRHHIAFLGLAAGVIGGCATAPESIRKPVGGPDVAEARAHPRDHAGDRVRWGGTISEINNLERRTEIIVVARPLTGSGEPLGDRASRGRFLAEFDRFLDPAVYQAGRRVTVVGRFTGLRPGRIGEYLYDYPVVRGEYLYAWEERVRRERRYPPPYYYRYPYWHYPYHGFGRYPWWWY